MENSLVLLACVLSLLTNSIDGEYVTSNVTKAKTSNVKSNNISLNTSVNPIPVAVVRTSTEAESQFSAPKAISVDADMSKYGAFPMPSSFPFPGGDDVEETFTYQVTKQKRPPMAPMPLNSSSTNWREEFDFLQKKARSESYKILQDYVSELHFQMEAKIQNVSVLVDSISSETQKNQTLLNSAFHHLSQEVTNLTASSKEVMRLVKLIHHSHEQERTTLLAMISNTTRHVEKLRSENTNQMARIAETLSKLQAKMENTTQQVRVHEAYLRYGQSTMATMRGSIDKNLERISELEMAGGPQWAEQTVGCGGVVVSNSGIISYKYREQYWNYERCVWVVRTNRRSQINLQLLDDGFQNQSNSDYLTITELQFSDDDRLSADREDQIPANPITSSRLEHGNKALHTFQGPVIFITFYSDGAFPGTGFTLRFDGVGNSSDPAHLNAVRHLNLHFTDPTGVFSYPFESSGMWYQPNELVTVAKNPTNASSVKIHMNRCDLEMDEKCEFDSVGFYGSVTGSYALTKRYCQHYENFVGEVIHSSDGLFLVIFRSDQSTQFSGFQFSWEIEKIR